VRQNVCSIEPMFDLYRILNAAPSSFAQIFERVVKSEPVRSDTFRPCEDEMSASCNTLEQMFECVGRVALSSGLWHRAIQSFRNPASAADGHGRAMSRRSSARAHLSVHFLMARSMPMGLLFDNVASWK